MQQRDGDALLAAALRGVGIALLPTFIAGPDLERSDLAPVLPGYHVPESGIFAIYPHNRHLSAKVRSFIDFLLPRYGERPKWDDWISKLKSIE